MRREKEPLDGHDIRRLLADTPEDQHWMLWEQELTKAYYSIENMLLLDKLRGASNLMPPHAELEDDHLGDLQGVFEDASELEKRLKLLLKTRPPHE